jgi:hypothetical protein
MESIISFQLALTLKCLVEQDQVRHVKDIKVGGQFNLHAGEVGRQVRIKTYPDQLARPSTATPFSLRRSN